ncbi:MAG: DUF6268 family outer membrane beta-barrel protein [Flavobacteriales bacterium]
MKIHLFIIGFMFIGSLLAQDTNANKPLSKFPLLNYSQTYYGKSNFSEVDENNNGETELKEYRMGIQFAFPLIKKKRYLLNKFDFTALDLKSRYNNFTEQTSNDFYSYAYSIGVIEVLKNRWKAIGILTPTLASDFRSKVSHEDFILQASLLFSKRSSAYFEYGFGLAYSTRFGRQQVVPLMTLQYKKNDWELHAVLPAFISGFRTRVNSKIGMTFSVFGNNYNFKENLSSPVDLDKIVYTRLTLGPEYEVKVYKAIHLNFYAGFSFLNKLESITVNDQIGLDLSSKTKVFGRLGAKILL